MQYKLKNFIFDFDGTLANSIGLVKPVIEVLAKKYDISLPSVELVDVLRKGGIEAVFKLFNFSDETLAQYIEDFRREMINNASQIEIYPGIKEVINEIKSRALFAGILTNNSVELAQKFCTVNEINSFEFIRSESLFGGKDIALTAILRDYSLNKNETAYIGDAPRDIIASKKAGVISVAAGWGNTYKEYLMREKPDYYFEKPTDLKVLYSRIL